MATLDNLSKNYATLIQEIETGQIKIPQFQRNFVWDKSQSAQLLDSMLKGYPIGTFIFWRTDEELRAVRNIGNIDLPEKVQTEFVNYVLDGQQRVTSFFAAIKGVSVAREGKRIDDFSTIWIDLGSVDDKDIVTTDITDRIASECIKVVDLMSNDYIKLSQIPAYLQGKVSQYRNLLLSYQFNVISLKGASISVATEVFTRLNVGGKSLSLFEIMVAKTYVAAGSQLVLSNNSKLTEEINETGFDLAVRYEQLLKELQPSQYDTLASATVLQTVSILAVKGCTRRQILDLDKTVFIETWPKAITAIKRAVDFFRSYGVPVSQLLPYNALIVPFSYFFSHHPSQPSGVVLDLL